MRKFSDPIVAEFSNDGKKLRLVEGFEYYLKQDHTKKLIIPSGFISDGFTNMGFSFVIPRYGSGLKCAILHDYMCDVLNGVVPRQKDFFIHSRKECDDLFLESMLEVKAFSVFKAVLIYYAVRLFAKVKGLK
ncbi:hypothetical protein [Helicobacter phage COL 5-PUJ]|uniref:DUF1353 domain-containing protein n=1 Tax=Helicobacter pylori TaxID=210 RepID=UPI001931E1BC|nr:DUF1353 domain-containing protein [Helicobacter pylori]MBS3010861.1 DUF1353 domain-containing protein [Helicobacter pylori]MBS3016760.1 DUF1353 domain-containing protein [Helicobacter pylori]QQO40049.1 hypothetical protein [Helicobacter phage COL 5-PUJ]QQO40080.1 hypothetical protein [Helicobacter phage COL 6-PUJ]